MALIQCPDCGLPVSDQSTACIHCGMPLTPKPAAQISEDLPCALVLTRAVFDDTGLVPLLMEMCQCSREEAEQLRLQTPVVLLRGLRYAQCKEVLRRFNEKSRASIYRDEDIESGVPLKQLTPLVSSAPPSNPFKLRQPLSFWQTVGAIMTASALLWVISLILSGLFAVWMQNSF